MLKAKHPKSVWFLSFLSACESVFFPIPIDPLLLALSVAQPKKALWYSFLVTCFSVLGAFVGYLIGFFFWDQIQSVFYHFLLDPEKVEVVFLELRKRGFWALFFSALTPIPYKVFTLASGVIQLDWGSFFLGSFLGRALRFMSIGVLFYIYGVPIHSFIERHFDKIVLGIGLLFLFAILAWVLIF